MKLLFEYNIIYLKNQIFMKKNIYWFTFIELLVFIAILSIITLWISKINFNYLIDKKKFITFNNNIISNIESIRNNSLYWKAFSWWIYWFINPKRSILTIKTWSWNDSFILIHSWSSLIYDNSYTIDFTNKWSIYKIDCKSITWTILDSNKTVVDLIFEGSNLSLSWCSSNSKILDITTKYKSLTWSILINTVSWIIEKK